VLYRIFTLPRESVFRFGIFRSGWPTFAEEIQNFSKEQSWFLSLPVTTNDFFRRFVDLSYNEITIPQITKMSTKI
jgi:hypothetical protein